MIANFFRSLRAAFKINRKERKERRDLEKLRDFFAISAFFAVNSLILLAVLKEQGVESLLISGQATVL